MVMGGVMFFWACQGQKKCDKRAQYVVDQIHNPKSDQVLVICHRGDWRNFPENSIPAIEAVIKMGADVVELDVALTKDSVLILMHDRTLDRCSTGKGLIAEKSYDEIKNLRLKSAHGAQNSLNLPIPTLREALEVCRDRIVVNID
ncbi:MAG: glycerophosphodiester phosphodiesterase family protein, partial [Alistipes sp.]|nr:glycerophosphodiester phosphodiesterase family protein [Alistipes sp.]